MRTELKTNGWKEIETTEITIKSMSFFQTSDKWVEFTKRYSNLNKKGRNHCQCCKRKWESFKEPINSYLAFTDKENKIICQDCYDKLK